MRHRIASTLLPCALLLALAAAPSRAQEQEPLVAPAPPAVRDFQLEPDIAPTSAPRREPPPIEIPRVQVLPPAATTIAPAGPPAATEPPPATADDAPAPTRRARPRQRPVQTRPASESPPAPPAEEPAPAVIDPGVEPAPPPPVASTPEPVAAEQPLPQNREFPWLYVAVGALALIAGLALLARRRRTAIVAEDTAPVEAAVAAPEPEPAPVAPPPPPRPRIALEFKPLMAGSTDDQAAVQFELAVRNVGDAIAHNVRIAIRMINASPRQDEELAAFFREPIATVDHRPLTIPPTGRAETRRTAVLPKEAVRAIDFQGKSLFIPVVAFNVLYEWGEGRQGQTATSFVVGRETDPPAEKMAPFRLDLGPRIYRTVGQRRNELELVA